MERSGYTSDVSDKQWERLQEYLAELSTRGAHLRKWELRVIINAILYVVTELLQKAIKLLKIKDKNQREMLTFSQVICANADEPCI